MECLTANLQLQVMRALYKQASGVRALKLCCGIRLCEGCRSVLACEAQGGGARQLGRNAPAEGEQRLRNGPPLFPHYPC